MRKLFQYITIGILLLGISIPAQALEVVRQKNVATYLTFPIMKNDGTLISSAADLDSEIDAWSDGAAPDGFADCTNEATEIGSTGQYYLLLAQGETNYQYIIIQVKSSSTGAVPQTILIRTTVGAPANLATTDDGGTINVTTGKIDEISTLTGHTAQTGDSYAIVNHADYGNAHLVRSTTPANTLDVSATGEAGLDFDNIKDATGAHTLTNITVPTVTTTGTATTVTNAVVLPTGTGAGQISLSSGAVILQADQAVNVTKIEGTDATDQLDSHDGNPPSAADIKSALEANGTSILDAISDLLPASTIAAATDIPAAPDNTTIGNIAGILYNGIGYATCPENKSIWDRLDAAITSRSSHSAADVVTAMQVVASDFKADVSGLATSVEIAALNDLSAADVNAEVDTALSDIKLNKLLSASATLADDVALGSVMGQLLDDGTAWSFDRASNSLEAISGLAGGTDWSANQKTEILAILGVTGTGTPDSTPTDGALKNIQDAIATAQVDLDNPSQYKADVSGMATSGNQTTIINHLTDIKGATFSGSTDSLEAIRDRGDAAWVTATGFSTHSAADVWAVLSRTLTSGGYSGLTATDIDNIWDEVVTGHSTTSSYGKLLTDNINATIGSRSSHSAADVWSAVTRTLSAGTNISLAKGTGITGFNDIAASDVATLILATPANKLATDASGRVTVGSNADKTGYTASTVSDKTGYTVSTVSDKTGYSLTQAFPTNFSSLAITAAGKVTVGTNSDKTGYTVSTVSDKAGYSLASPQTFNLTGNITGNLSGSVGSLTTWDKTGYRLSATGVDDIWNETQSGHTAAGTFGKYLDAQVSLINGGSGLADWTDDEKKQIRDALGVDGDKTTAAGGQLQDIDTYVNGTKDGGDYNGIEKMIRIQR